MKVQFESPPADGAWITIGNQFTLKVPDNPIIGLIKGDGVGPDIVAASIPVFDAAVEKAFKGKRYIRWWELPAGESSFAKYGEYLPEETFDAIKRAVVVLKGPLTTPVGGGFRSLNVTLRQKLDLYACIRPIKYIPGTPSPVLKPEDVDMVIFRENTEDVYAGIEWKSGSPEAEKVINFLNQTFKIRLPESSAIGLKPMSPAAVKRLVRRAIRYALDHGRKRVTLVHKGNIMKFTEGAFREWGYELAHDEFGDKIVLEKELAEYGNAAS